MIKCITFDITNTLIKVAGGSVGVHYSNIISKKHNYKLDVELANRNFKKYFVQQNKLFPGYGYSQGISSRNWWFGIVKNIIRQDLVFQNIQQSPLNDQDVIETISNEIFDEFKKPDYWQKYPNCDHVLQRLKQKGLKLGVISNFDERLFDIIKSLGLDIYFDFVCIPSNSDGAYKPQKEIFDIALKKSGVQMAKEMLHIGDNIELDYEPALNSNFNSVLLLHDKDAEISSVKNFSALSSLSDKLKETQNFVFSLDQFLEIIDIKYGIKN